MIVEILSSMKYYNFRENLDRKIMLDHSDFGGRGHSSLVKSQ